MYKLYKDGNYMGQFPNLAEAMTEGKNVGIKSSWKGVSLSPMTWKTAGIKNSKTGEVSGVGLIVYEEEE